MKCPNCGHDVPYSSIDNLVAEWAANKFGFKPEDFIEIGFTTYDACYSEYTQDYGVTCYVRYYETDGRGDRCYKIQSFDDWNLPAIIEDMYEYKQAKERAVEEHHARHCWEY